MGVPVCAASLGLRAAVDYAAAAGASAQEYEPRGKAAAEIASIYAFVRQAIGLSTTQQADLSTSREDHLSTSRAADLSTSRKADLSTGREGDTSTERKVELPTRRQVDPPVPTETDFDAGQTR